MSVPSVPVKLSLIIRAALAFTVNDVRPAAMAKASIVIFIFKYLPKDYNFTSGSIFFLGFLFY
jgi:hypothetical protein